MTKSSKNRWGHFLHFVDKVVIQYVMVVKSTCGTLIYLSLAWVTVVGYYVIKTGNICVCMFVCVLSGFDLIHDKPEKTPLSLMKVWSPSGFKRLVFSQHPFLLVCLLAHKGEGLGGWKEGADGGRERFNNVYGRLTSDILERAVSKERQRVCQTHSCTQTDTNQAVKQFQISNH